MIRHCRPLVATVLLLLFTGGGEAEVAPKSGNPTFDRAVDLVMENFYDATALPRFEEAVSHAGAAGRRGATKIVFEMHPRSPKGPAS